MNHLRAWLLRFTGIFTGKSREHEMAEELESRLQMHIADNLRAGMSPEEAPPRGHGCAWRGGEHQAGLSRPQHHPVD